uniref:Uncharacterized protein n=1 Tax=Arundo donax TaxID=35708 RepID=A0A0A9F779_ARUDO
MYRTKMSRAISSCGFSY